MRRLPPYFADIGKRLLKSPKVYFRDTGLLHHFLAQGDEVDLLVEGGGKRIPFEIKLHSAPNAEDARGLFRCMTDLGLRRGYLVYPGREPYSLGHGVTALPAEALLVHPERVARL